MYRFSLCFVLFVCLSVTMVSAQTEQIGYFLTRLGNDTIAMEEFSLSAQGIRGTSVTRTPRTLIREYTGKFNPDGNLKEFRVTAQTENGTVVNDRNWVYSNDSVLVTAKQDTTTSHYTVVTRERPFPLFFDMFGTWQVILQHAAATNKFDVIQGKRVVHYTINGKFPGKAQLTTAPGEFGPLAVETDIDGRIDKFDMTATTDKFVAEQITAFDMKSVIKDFAGREKSGRPLGVLSPRDSVSAEINGAHLKIVYSRPAVRGRTVFGGVVTWDSVWRTGANAATQLVTDKELRFGQTSLPPGTYTLFTIPAKDKWTLIINSQHGQWGTDYDQSKDFARLPMDVKKNADLTERFTISVEPGTNQGVLRLKWEYTDAAIAFTVQ